MHICVVIKLPKSVTLFDFPFSYNALQLSYIVLPCVCGNWRMIVSLEIPGVRIPAGGKIFFSVTSRRTLGPREPPVQWYRGSFPGAMRMGREVDQPPLSTTKLKNERSYTSTPPYTPSCRAQGQFFLCDFRVIGTAVQNKIAAALPTV
jgi:hypothetical protein